MPRLQARCHRLNLANKAPVRAQRVGKPEIKCEVVVSPAHDEIELFEVTSR
jgi:hypothetical protein